MGKFRKKALTQKDKDGMWGEEGPYSEVSLIEQTRILDNSISRVFLVVEAKINPFTFEYVLENRNKFADVPSIQDLLDHAEYRGQSEGYTVGAGEEELIDKRSYELAFSYRQKTIEHIIQMHNFVIDEFGLKKFENKSVKGIKISDLSNSRQKYIWDEKLGGVAAIDDNVWSADSYVSSPAGEKNGKIRYFVILVLAKEIALNREDTISFCNATKKTALKLNVDIENVEANRGYVMITALIDTETAPADFVEDCVKDSNANKSLFLKDYFITNISRPSWNQIEGFLRKFKKH